MATTPLPPLLKPNSVEPAEPSSPNQPGERSIQKKRSGLHWVLLALGVLVLFAGIAGGIYFVRHRGHKPGASVSAASSKNSSAAAASRNSAPQAVIDLPLDPFVVNLADAGGHSYARIGLTLRLATTAGSKQGAAAENGAAPGDDLRDMERDQIISVLNRQQSADLLAPDGKERLKQAIAAAIAAKYPQTRVVDIYFTQFLVQS